MGGERSMRTMLVAKLTVLAPLVIATLVAVLLQPSLAAAGTKTHYFGGVPNISLSSTFGVSLSEVRPDSPAERAGLRAGDIIVQLGEVMIRDHKDFVFALRSTPPGTPARVTYLRQGQEYQTEVVLVPRRKAR
jgi:S1-C subfamily serine protease